MKSGQRDGLIDQVSRELQGRYKTYELQRYLDRFGIAAPKDVPFNSKWVYAKAALASTPAEVILKIAEDLEIDAPSVTSGASLRPRNWEGTDELRLFISHLSKDKEKAIRLRTCLSPLGISAFVAHEDIKPTLSWQTEIERALFSMEAFVAIITPGYSDSVWCQQEVGFAMAKGCKIIALRMGEDPRGFIAKMQALSRKGKRAEQIANEIRELLSEDVRTVGRIAPKE